MRRLPLEKEGMNQMVNDTQSQRGFPDVLETSAMSGDTANLPDTAHLPDEICIGAETANDKLFEDPLQTLRDARSWSEDKLQDRLQQILTRIGEHRSRITELQMVENEIRGFLRERTDIAMLQAQLENERKARAELEEEHRATLATLSQNQDDIADKESQIIHLKEDAGNKELSLTDLERDNFMKDGQLRERDTLVQQLEADLAESEERNQEACSKLSGLEQQFEENKEQEKQRKQLEELK
eukprot:gene12266-14486_t